MAEIRRLAPACIALGLSTLALTGCQNFAGVASNTAQIRIIDASPGAPTLDLYQGSQALSYNLTFGNITSYIPVASGSADLSANISGSRQSIAKSHETLAPGQYTLLVTDSATGIQPLLLKDRTAPAPPGQVSLRFLTQVTALAAYDVYLVPPAAGTASPILTHQAFGANSGYLNVPAGSYRIVLYPSGTQPSSALPAAYSGPTVLFPSGAVRTIVLIDQPVPLRPVVQIVVASDD